MRKKTTLVAGLVLALGTSTATAAWDFIPAIEVGGAHSDNLTLQPRGSEAPGEVAMLIPEFTLSGRGQRLEADLSYRAEAYFYGESDNNSIFHVLDATATATILRDALFVYGSASNSQGIISPEGSIPTNNLPITKNRVDARVFELMPYWDQDLGTWASIYLAAKFADVTYDDPLIQGAQGIDSSFRLDNLRRGEGLTWGLNYESQQMKYEFSPKWEYQRAWLELGYWLNDSTRVFASGGQESPFDDPDNPDLEDSFWEAGVVLGSGGRMQLELAGGERSYGNSFRARWVYALKRGSTELSYTESPTTQSRLMYDRRPIEDPGSPEGGLDRPGLGDRFLAKRGEWRTTVELAKSTLDFRIFAERRENRTNVDGQSLPDENISDVSARLSWRMGSKTELGVGAGYTNRELGNPVGKNEISRISLEMSYDLGRHTSLNGWYRYTDQSYGGDSLSGYEENQLALFVRWEM